ncbi:lipopolysaccharide-induced tumor necrosis factor-alpha factor-like [Trichogramma pretiosum]|uniref:lipopolysaccharide-induced tumor necrosis factor-alpha factor-like n=1 Tax=Trichogramma pretiosum TaxID=7493 RepID=UPI0006C990DE|nr:lipopolysaccharide-induced tumor necrosis factor-alpha factor-like [Trichogramma pretiosum]XP_014234664.1 lipopolysaccharide-induced tumor necrosis factor-alpha factor-like [Trichogramma pretiosum]
MNKGQGGPPPPAGFVSPPPYSPNYPTPMQETPVVIVQQTQFGPDPQSMQCPHCHSTITTQIQTEATGKTHIIALLLCLFGLCPCAACVYCMDGCQAKKHYCPACHQYLGIYDN